MSTADASHHEPAPRSCCGGPDSATASGKNRTLRGYRALDLLRDGTPVCVRAILPEDKERLRMEFERLSPRSVYQRFFNPITELTPGVLQHLTEVNFRDHVGFVLTIEGAGGERLVAVARFVRVPSNAGQAEVGFAVADDFHNRGAATLLLRHLVAAARSCGVRELVAQMLDDNLAMLRVLEKSDLPLRQRTERGIRHVLLTIASQT